MKKSIKKSLVLLSICCLSVLTSATSVFGNAATTEEIVTAYFAPELTPGSKFTWKVNEFWGMSEWLNSESSYDPIPGDLWELNITGEIPSLTLNGSISSNISEWYKVDFDTSIDLRDSFEYNIAGHDFVDVFGSESIPAQNWRMLNQLFILPYTVEDENGVIQNFADFYGASFDGVEGEMDVDTTGGSLKLDGHITDGQYQNNSIDLNCSIGLVEEFVYEKKQYDTGISLGKVNITLIESEFGTAPKPEIPGYSYLLVFGGIFVGIITVVVYRKLSKEKINKTK